MKGNIVILLLSLIVLEFVYAFPRVSIKSRSQALRKDKKKVHGQKKLHKAAIRQDEGNPDYDEDEGNIAKLNNNGEEKYIERPLAAGDTFTARELLPVAEKLFEKIENPGEGKGIVSSALRPEDLADKLFQGFFMTPHRIVTLSADDITGLDALQSLALAGEPATRTKFADQTKKKEKKVIDLNGQRVEIDDQSWNTSRLKVITKKTLVRVPKNNKTKESEAFRRQRIKLIQKLGKNRHVVVSRKNMKNNGVKTAPCRWSYECKDPTNLDTCQLNAKCLPHKLDEKVDHNQYINSKLDVNPKILAQFRKALSISALDEEVEKIIENRILKLKPKNMESSEKVESLSEYFRKIILSGDKDVTKSAFSDYEYYNNDPTEQNQKEKLKLTADDNGTVKRLKSEDAERRVKWNRKKY